MERPVHKIISRHGERKFAWEPFCVLVTTGVALFALIFSYLSIREQQRSIDEGRQLAHDNATQQIIHDQYALCRELDQLRIEHPELSHMLALPNQGSSEPWNTYYSTKERVRHILLANKINGSVTRADKDEIYLKEHALALKVFDIYEQTVYQWQIANDAKDSKRADILKMLVEYYEGRMLRNPRLRYHWKHGGADMMEENPTRARYNTHVGDDALGQSVFSKDFVDTDSPLETISLAK